MISLFYAAVFSVFLQNLIFERALGLNILLYAAQRRRYVAGFAAGISYVTTVSAAIVYIFDRYFVVNSEFSILLNSFRPFIYMVAVGIVYVASVICVWRFLPNLFSEIRQYVHLSGLNSSVLGALFLNSAAVDSPSIFTYLGYGIGSGAGFLLAAYFLYTVHERLNNERVPAAFRGMPIMIVYIGIISLALYAFVGYTTEI